MATILRYKIAKNVFLPFEFGRVRIERFVQQPTPIGPKIIPLFLMDEIHELHLADETPNIPEKIPGMSKRHHDALKDDAVKIALENRRANIKTRALFDLYVAEGVLTPEPEAVS